MVFDLVQFSTFLLLDIAMFAFIWEMYRTRYMLTPPEEHVV